MEKALLKWGNCSKAVKFFKASCSYFSLEPGCSEAWSL